MTSSRRLTLFDWLTYLFLACVAAVNLVPFIWMLSTSLQPPTVNPFEWPPHLLPVPATLAHYVSVLTVHPFARFAFNSAVVAIALVLANLATSSLAGFALARLDFPGRKAIFYAILATMSVPFTVILVPLFVITTKLRLTDSYLGLILPFSAGAFNIFLMRQAFFMLPVELEHAARIDGCNTFQLFHRVMLPLVKPTAATVAIFTFVGSWSNFLWPLVTLKSDKLYTLPLGLAYFQGQFYGNWYQLAAGSVLIMLPIVILFLSAQRYFIRGIASGAVKG